MICPHCGKETVKQIRFEDLSQADITKFWKYVVKTESCWICIAGKSHAYGRLMLGRKKYILAHVLSWIIHHGSVTPGMKIAHSCDNKRCVNPDHLSEKTNSQNVKEAVDRGLLKHFSGENNPSAKISNSDLNIILRELALKTSTIKELAIRYGVSFQCIYRIALGKGRKDITKPVIEVKNAPFLTAEQVRAVRKMALSGDHTRAEIGELFGIHQGHVSCIKRNVRHSRIK